MNNYERLTICLGKGFSKLKACITYRLPYCDENCTKCDDLTKAIRRLAEFEDKIENGTMVELPAPLGSELWRIQMPSRRLDDGSVTTILSYRKATVEKCEYPLTLSNVELVGKYYFLSREQAEARLKEFKEENTK